MPAVLHTGAQGKNLQSLVNLIANSSAFQLRRGVQYDLDALPYIFYPFIERDDKTLEELRPFAVIEVPDGAFRWTGPSNALYPSGMFNLLLTDNDRYYKDFQASYTDFLNFADGVVADIAEKSNTDDAICIINIDQTQSPVQNSPKEAGAVAVYWWAKYEITYTAIGGEA